MGKPCAPRTRHHVRLYVLVEVWSLKIQQNTTTQQYNRTTPSKSYFPTMSTMTLRTVLLALAMGTAVAFTPASGRGRVRSRAMMSTNDLYSAGAAQQQGTKGVSALCPIISPPHDRGFSARGPRHGIHPPSLPLRSRASALGASVAFASARRALSADTRLSPPPPPANRGTLLPYARGTFPRLLRMRTSSPPVAPSSRRPRRASRSSAAPSRRARASRRRAAAVR